MNRVCELLNIEYPIIQGGMAWVADENLASAVSNAGGLGLIAAGATPIDVLRNQIRKCREMTDKPFGVNIMLMSETASDVIDLVIEEGVEIITTGAGNPAKYMEKLKSAGVKVMPVVPTPTIAVKMEAIGVDAVIVEGTEAGGHIGELTTMVLVPQAKDVVKIPVIAAGGIADGRAIAAAYMLGAEGVQVGTRFLASTEVNIHENYKQMIVNAKDKDAIATGRSTGHPVRGLNNKFAMEFLKMEMKGATAKELEAKGSGALRKAVIDGDIEEGSFMAGQIAAAVNKIQPCKEIVEEMFSEAKEVLNKSEVVI